MARYQDGEKIGSGGFGEVRRCRRDEDNREFAKKVLLLADEESQRRFQREVRILSKLDHPRVIRVVASKLSSAPMWYAMPLYERSLRDEFPGIVSNEERIRKVLGAVLEGMQYAHEQGVLHRDLKPENVLLNSDDDVVISDFGLGRTLETVTTRVTATGDRFGTPGYSAPEQTTNAKTADERADVFALGRMLYELYTGDNPSAVQDLSKSPAGIAAIIDRCTKTDPSKRFQSVTELRRAFQNVAIASDRQSDTALVKSLLSTAIAKGILAKNDVIKLTGALERCQADVDLLHEVCIGLPELAMSQLWNQNRFLVRQVVDSFCNQVVGQGWGFSYVDTIGGACVRMFRAIDDADVRASIVHAILHVSVDHNRWRAMQQTAELIMSATSPAEDLAIAERIRPIRGQLQRIRNQLTVGKLGPGVAALLDSGAT